MLCNEDLTREDSAFVGWEAIKKYQEETKENTPSNMKFVLDEMTEGDKACTIIWHVEFNTRLLTSWCFLPMRSPMRARCAM